MVSALLALAVVPLWAFSSTPVMPAIGPFLMQIAVQSSWGGAELTVGAAAAPQAQPAASG